MPRQHHNHTLEILLVEDDPGDVLLIEESLEDSGFPLNLHHVDNGISALQFVQKSGGYATAKTPDLILLDLNLPAKDGRAVLREIKGNPQFRKIPVVVLTTSESPEDITHAYELGANCYISKPIDLDTFSEFVAAIEQFWFNIVKFPS